MPELDSRSAHVVINEVDMGFRKNKWDWLVLNGRSSDAIARGHTDDRELAIELAIAQLHMYLWGYK